MMICQKFRMTHMVSLLMLSVLYVICPCCGYEFGFDDESKGISFSEYRDNWIYNGFRFFNKKRKPLEWGETEMQRQLGNIKK